MNTLFADSTDSDLAATARAHGHVVGPALLDPYLSHLHYVCCAHCSTVLYQSDLPQTSRLGARAFQLDGENESARLSICAAAPALAAAPAGPDGFFTSAAA